ncbi:radical SAM protein [uncultured Bacteroides sp.]|uniref:radical SAM/SPASM domain-containing protein n=1 Tax=uncultured Bacteroides sp. TaxID=162156 RepID=UPI003459A1AC
MHTPLLLYNRKVKFMRIYNVMFDITDNCNFRCNHCYKNFDDTPIDLDYDRVLHFLNQLEASGYHPNIVISGGEPLLYPQIVSLLNALGGKYNIRINTNGLFLDKYLTAFLNVQNLKIQISLDGYDSDTFFAVRNNFNFEKIVQNAKLAHDAGLNVYFRATLTSKTYDNYENFFDLSHRIGIPLVLRPMVNTGEDRQQNLSIGYETLVHWCEEIAQKDYFVWTGGRNILSENACPLQRNIISILTVDNKGNVYPCSLLRGKHFYMGNINTDTLEEILSHAEAAFNEVTKILNSTSCQACGFRKQIGDGTCVASCYFGNKKCVGLKIKGCDVE